MFSDRSYAKVWQILDRKAKYTKAKISTNRKDMNGQYQTDFSSVVKLIGKAHTANVQEGDRIRILSCGVTNSYNKETQTTYTDFLIFDLEKVGSAPAAAPTITPQQPSLLEDMDLPSVDEADLPF